MIREKINGELADLGIKTVRKQFGNKVFVLNSKTLKTLDFDMFSAMGKISL